MRIGLNALFLNSNVGGGLGGGTRIYAYYLLDELAKIDSKNQYYIFLNQDEDSRKLPKRENFYYIISRINLRTQSLRYLYEQVILPMQAITLHLDVIHSLAYVGPIFSHCPSVISIHDTNFITMKNLVRTSRRIGLGLFSRLAAMRSTKIITLSNFSKMEIIKNFKILPGKIEVIYLGPGQGEEDIERTEYRLIQEKYLLNKPYIVALSGKSAHKNISRLIEAFGLIQKCVEHNLVIIGVFDDEGYQSNLIKRVQFTGYVSRNDFNGIMAEADLFVMPSLYEGFGLPIIEAQRLGVPVVAASAGAIPEIIGDQPVLFDPYSINDIAEKIYSTLIDINLRNRLVNSGQVNSLRYSWRKTTEQTLSLYESLLSH